MSKSDSTPIFSPTGVLGIPGKAMRSLVDSISNWPEWWRELSVLGKILPILLMSSYWTALSFLNGFRGDHLYAGTCILLLSYIGKSGRNFLKFLLPFFLTGVVYDSQRFYADYIRGPIHVKEPYSFDKAFFGITSPQGVLTPNEWWQLHSHPALDLITGFAYLVFFALFILIAGYFYWVGSAEISRRARRMPWAFFWLNVIGYTTYYWYAAAPPWYVALYGLGPARLDVEASSAGCARFDQILGTHFFSAMYGRAADVFGAIPSLHVAYPLLALLFALQFRSSRVFCAFFYLIMCFSAVYLNHHYILDILWGSSYAVLSWWGVNKIYDIRERKGNEFNTCATSLTL